MQKKRWVSILLALVMLLSLTACGINDNAGKSSGGTGANKSSSTGSDANDGKIKEFTAFFSVPGTEISSDNKVQAEIAKLIGAECKETWLTGQSSAEAIGTMIAGGEYPDFISGGVSLYEAEALIPLDEYWDDYPNIKNFWTERQWDQVRQDDGHIYWIPQFGRIYGRATDTLPAEAFWIQTRVLKWAGYPEINTMDEYFDLIERYNEANPTMEDGTTNIPYTILCDDWRYFCLENAPQFLDGYPNDGSVIVEPDTQKVVDYNTTPTAKVYFQKLNEEFQKGIVDPESFTQTYDEYIAKLSTGRVLGMIDQYWQFGYNVDSVFKQTGLDKQGCNYVPLSITIDDSVTGHWVTVNGESSINASEGVGITISCQDVPGALKFLNDLLSPEVSTLRHWGIKGEDYEVDENGLFYKTPEQRAKATDTQYQIDHFCKYNYFPNYIGMNLDGINAATPDCQPGEFYDNLSDDVKECFAAYGVQTHVEMMKPDYDFVPGPWFPMYSHSNVMTTDTPGGMAWNKMGEIKKQYLPRVVMAEDFETAWAEYLEVYAECKPEDFLAEMQVEVENRIALAEKYK